VLPVFAVLMPISEISIGYRIPEYHIPDSEDGSDDATLLNEPRREGNRRDQVERPIGSAERQGAVFEAGESPKFYHKHCSRPNGSLLLLESSYQGSTCCECPYPSQRSPSRNRLGHHDLPSSRLTSCRFHRTCLSI
jgi:hypothetical protein